LKLLKIFVIHRLEAYHWMQFFSLRDTIKTFLQILFSKGYPSFLLYAIE